MNFQEYKKNNQNKKVLVFGLGLQGGGVSSALFFSTITSNLRITDLKSEEELKTSLDKLGETNFTKTFGQHKNEDIEWADIIVFNQDIFNKDPNSEYLTLAVDLGKQIETEIGLFVELCQCPIIGVTGTRGKTTTTIAISKLLENCGLKVFSGGNIPDSQNLANVEKTSDYNFAVLELSNFQLHGLHFKKISPQYSIVTSISPDHLASYTSMENYINDKTAISTYQKQEDHLIINKNIDYLDLFTKNTQAQIHYFDENTFPADWKLTLPGIHNRQNLSAVFTLSQILNLDQCKVKESLENFEGVEFRLQKIAQHNGITFINDTTASTPTAANIALKSFPAGKIIWIAGGNTKNLPISELVETARETVNNYVFLEGTGTQDLISNLQKTDPEFSTKNLGLFNDFKLAISKALGSAQSGDYILLSPAFTSFGMFENEFDRGRQFNQIVEQLIAIN